MPTTKLRRCISVGCTLLLGSTCLLVSYQLGAIRHQQLNAPSSSSTLNTRIASPNWFPDENQGLLTTFRSYLSSPFAFRLGFRHDRENIRMHADHVTPIPHPSKREDRFPSVDERIKMYMSNWFQPPCDNNNRISYEIHYDNDMFPTLRFTGEIQNKEQTEFSSIVQPDTKILLDNETIVDCGRSRVLGDPGWGQLEKRPRTEPRIFRRGNVWNYCKDSLEIINITNKLNAENGQETPLILQMGDHASLSRYIPVIAKFRGRMSPAELERVTDASTCSDRPFANTTVPMVNNLPGFAPIVWNLNSIRHFGPLNAAMKEDIPWHEKKLGTLWRGYMTGYGMVNSEESTELDQCLSNPRCRFVYETNSQNGSSLIDAALIGMDSSYKGGTSCNGVQLLKNRTTYGELQQYKVLLSLEGNDVSSGLKWNLLSNSVVLMPAPTITSWALEELLEPWVHYVPVHANLSNLEDMIRWVGANDDHARHISERATLFIKDLWTSPEAKEDNKKVMNGIMDRYRRHWLRDTYNFNVRPHTFIV